METTQAEQDQPAEDTAEEQDQPVEDTAEVQEVDSNKEMGHQTEAVEEIPDNDAGVESKAVEDVEMIDEKEKEGASEEEEEECGPSLDMMRS